MLDTHVSIQRFFSPIKTNAPCRTHEARHRRLGKMAGAGGTDMGGRAVLAPRITTKITWSNILGGTPATILASFELATLVARVTTPLRATPSRARRLGCCGHAKDSKRTGQPQRRPRRRPRTLLVAADGVRCAATGHSLDSTAITDVVESHASLALEFMGSRAYRHFGWRAGL